MLQNISKINLLIPSVLVALLAVSGGCDFFSPRQDEKVKEAYGRYKQAIQSEDIASLRKLVAKEKARELEGEQAPQIIGLLKAMYPQDAAIKGLEVKGDAAAMTLTGKAEGGTLQGTVKFIKEDGHWKIQEESWELKMSLESPMPETRQEPASGRPYDYAKIVGNWRGFEAGRPGGEWEFAFDSAYVVLVKGPRGETYRGSAYARFDLGLDRNALWVLPGGAPFDVLITEAPDQKYLGTYSLGSYMLSGDVLKLCGGEPGLMKRTKEFTSAGGIRCFELRRAS